jgi:hypothetical protein
MINLFWDAKAEGYPVILKKKVAGPNCPASLYFRVNQYDKRLCF